MDAAQRLADRPRRARPHAPEAAAILDLDACENPPDAPLAEPSDRFRHVVWRMSPPTRFGDKYRDEVIAAPRITLGVPPPSSTSASPTTRGR